MRLTWTFFSKNPSGSITLTVVYLPKLDKFGAAGYLEIDTNTAYVGWDSFQVFNKGDNADKKALFGSLVRVDHFSPLTPL